MLACEHCERSRQDVEVRHTLCSVESPILCTGCLLEAEDCERDIRRALTPL
jgi:hypothetical protein